MEPEFEAYVGPRPFEEKDKAIFFGRDREARDLRSLVIVHNLVLVYAQSGAGKTSLINAGLIPLLKKKQFEVLPVARVKCLPLKNIRTDEISNIYVFNALTSWVEGEYNIEHLAKMKLIDFLNGRERMLDEAGMPLPRAVIFDQFEEIFSSYQDRWKDKGGFFEQVNTALEADPLLRVVFVMREEFIAQLDSYADLLPEGLRTRFHMERLRRDAALLAIREPLRNTGRFFAKGVAEKLVDDLLTIQVETMPGKTAEVKGEFIEAVQLQVVCQNLWRKLPPDEKQITLQHLKTFGNVEEELSRFYDEAIRAAVKETHVDEEGLRRLCGEVLITEMGTRGMVYRAQDSTGGVPNVAIDVLKSLHLIRAESRAGARWYELIHDSFIKPIQSSNKVFNDKLVEKKRAEKEWWAIIVGISKYKDKSLNLKYADRDAEEVYKLLRAPAGGGFKEDHIKKLINEEATNSEIIKALRSFLKKPCKDDIVILYFACHGSPDPERPKIIYLLPHDTDCNDISGTALPMDEIKKSLEDYLNAERVVIIADTCHSAAIGGGIGKRNLINIAKVTNAYLQAVSTARDGVALLTSAEANESSQEGEQWGGGHGVFTHYLLQGMQGYADGYGQQKDGIVTVGELFEYVRDKVREATDNKQHPAIGTNRYDRNLPIAISSIDQNFDA